MEKKKMLGVLGGMGPMATAYFMELVIRMTDAETDQEHLDMLVYNLTSIPDRTGFILGKTKESPLPTLIRAGQALAEQGAEQIAIPCMTSHYFYRQLSEAVPVPVLNCLAETADCLKAGGVERAGILATTGTMETGIFRDALLSRGIQPVALSRERQADVMSLIYDDIKANRPPRMELFHRAGEELRQKGAEIVILGCTELSLIKRDCSVGGQYLDTLEVLARAAVRACGGKLNPRYRELIRKKM